LSNQDHIPYNSSTEGIDNGKVDENSKEKVKSIQLILKLHPFLLELKNELQVRYLLGGVEDSPNRVQHLEGFRRLPKKAKRSKRMH